MRTVLHALILALPASSAFAQSFVVEVEQEATPGAGDWVSLGWISPYETAETVAEHYGWDCVALRYGGNAPQIQDPLAQADTSILFLHRDTQTGDVALVAVHDRQQSLGGRADVSVDLFGDPDGAGWLVQDDTPACGTPSDVYTPASGPSSSFNGRNRWGNAWTDGWAIGPLDGDWSAIVTFNEWEAGDSFPGLQAWKALSSDGAELPLALAVGQRVRLRLFGAPVGAVTCGPALPTSTGSPASLLASGSLGAAQNDLTLVAYGLPAGQLGYALMSETSTAPFTPAGSQGLLCLGGTIARLTQPDQLISGPFGAIPVDLSAVPLSPPQAVMSNETWHFQVWFRDMNPASTSNFTPAIGATFQ